MGHMRSEAGHSPLQSPVSATCRQPRSRLTCLMHTYKYVDRMARDFSLSVSSVIACTGTDTLLGSGSSTLGLGSTYKGRIKHSECHLSSPLALAAPLPWVTPYQAALVRIFGHYLGRAITDKRVVYHYNTLTTAGNN
jgi:hypothetical protein